MIMVKRNKREIGSRYEEIAAAYFLARNYQILKRNFYTLEGEVDIIARDKEFLVFIEVRYRINTRYGHPLESISLRKKQRLVSAAKIYLRQEGLSLDIPCRFDVLGILGSQDQRSWISQNQQVSLEERDVKPLIEHIENAWQLDEV
ncbi:hypothetical protein FACS189418_6720 [Clostridia bacterium]|nr:hypothetical protein FACS189418_6720 [Clostridia bacterium]